MPALAAAKLLDPIAGGYVDETGQLVLRDAFRGYLTKPVWPQWVATWWRQTSFGPAVYLATASSLDGIVSDTVKVVVTGSSFSSGYQQAMLLLVADAKADFPETLATYPSAG